VSATIAPQRRAIVVLAGWFVLAVLALVSAPSFRID
jgi:hypothetical protein